MSNASTAPAGTSMERPPVLGSALPWGIVSRITLSLGEVVSPFVGAPVVSSLVVVLVGVSVVLPVVVPVVPVVVPVVVPLVRAVPVVVPVVPVVPLVLVPLVVPVVPVVVGRHWSTLTM